tara:strand:+ start:114 stop:647 length:534 start_codon:yes stop_codon:yes gene_type:complete
MQQIKKVTKYVKALYDLSIKNNCTEEIANHLEEIFLIYSNSSEFQLFLKSRRIGSKQKKEILNKILIDNISFIVLDLLNNLIDNDDLNLLKLITNHFRRICEKDEKKVAVTLTTVKELNSEEKQNILIAIENKLNKKIDLTHLFDKDIIGGVKLRIGNLIVDGSISTRLNKLKKVLY